MPFPTVEGKTFQQDLETVKRILGPVVTSALSLQDADELWLALNRLYLRLDRVSTQLYYKVWDNETDLSQLPL